MKTSTAIIVGVVLLIVVGVAFWILGTIGGKIDHNEKCAAWSADIEDRRIQMESQLFPDTASFNQDVAAFNRECAF